MGQLLRAAGFVATFIEANYLIGDWSNSGFYGRTCHVMLQHFAVYITLGVMNSIDIRQSDRFSEPDFSRLQRIVFANVQQASTELKSVLHEEAANSSPTHQMQSPMFRVGAYEEDRLVGWSCGWMERGRVFYMANSGVIESHRRQGIYTALLDAVRKHALSEGAITLRSQHSVMNNPVVIAKLRAGFNVSGLSQSAQMGMLVELTQHLSQMRQAMYVKRVLPYVAPDA